MRIKSIELNNFKRFTHLIIDGLPETAKLVVLVGPNGCGKTSLFEAFNHYYKYTGFTSLGDFDYLVKAEGSLVYDNNRWYEQSSEIVNIQFFDMNFPKKFGDSNIRGHFYFRTAYRNEADFNIDTMKRQDDPTESFRLKTLIQNDMTVSSNYQRLVASTISDVYDSCNDEKTIKCLREELIGKIKSSLTNIFNDLNLSSIGNPLNNGSFYFNKGSVNGFHYRNLSAGEKAAFDLILDIIIQSKYYPNAIYCIDEPESHMHTQLQGKVLRELYSFIPESSQLWISTHSIGMLQEADEIEKLYPGSVVFLDFGERDFDTDEVIKPAKITKTLMNKFYELAFGDFAKLMLPRKIVFCEGNPEGKKRKDFDKTIYTTIFSDNHPDVFFLSAKSCGELENIENSLGEIMTTLLQSTEIIKVIDLDDRSREEVNDYMAKGIRVLSRRNLESYLLDDEVLKLLCISKGQPEKYNECINIKQVAVQNSIKRKNAPDDLKSASGEIFNELKGILALTQCGNSAPAFLRNTMAPLITYETKVYKELEQDIFG